MALGTTVSPLVPQEKVARAPWPIDPNSGYDAATSTFRSLRPHVPLPPESEPLSVTSYVLSLLPEPMPSNPALVDATTGESISFPGMISQLRSLAASLHFELGVSKGDAVFILAPPSLEIPILCLAVLSIGAVVTPANPASTAAEIAHQIHLSKPQFFFATTTTAAKLPSDVAADHILIDSPRFKSFLANPHPLSVDVEVGQHDTAEILFSSGTTGLPKAAALTHRIHIAMIAGYHALQPPNPSAPETKLLAAPMFHAMGLFWTLKGMAFGDTTVVVVRPGMGEILVAAEQHRVTQIESSPPVVAALAKSEDAASRDFSRLRSVMCGGAPLAEDAVERFRDRYPEAEICVIYGSTEAGAIARMFRPDEVRCARSVGRLAEYMEAKIVDVNTGEALGVGQPGELWVRGPSVMKGYLGDDEANACNFSSDGWLKTGDLCYFDQNGLLFIEDRLKEMIKYNAYQVPPAELENVLQTMPGIVDSAVIPYPHESAGQIPMAFVVKKPGSSISEAEVMDFVAKEVAPYKKIRKVAFINSIPKSAAGKILRRELVVQALNGPICR